MLNLVGQEINNIIVLEKLPRQVNSDGKLFPITYKCKCLLCGNVFEATTHKIMHHKGVCKCQVEKIKQLALQRLIKSRGCFQDDVCCAYVDKDCKRKDEQVCCWDCEDYSQCLKEGIVCLNSPAKCGCKHDEKG